MRTMTGLATITIVGLLPCSALADIFGFEAESGSTPAGRDAYRVQSDDEALGGQYIDSDHRDVKDPLGDFAVFREYSLTIPPGDYALWGRILTPTFFSYDPDFSDDPESTEADQAFESDSFFAPATLGGDPLVDLDRANGFASNGRFDGSGDPPRANLHDDYAWINLTDGIDLEGLGPSEGTVDTVPLYTSEGGAVSFTIMSREGGLRHDAFAFVRDGLLPTEEELDEAAKIGSEPIDINSLQDAINAGDMGARFDVNGDGKVDIRDQDAFVTETLKTWTGDSNLDGEFNSGDFVVVFTAGEYEDNDPGDPTTIMNSLWEDGDWNADRDFDSGDFVKAFTDGGYEMGPLPGGVAAVPEPGSAMLLLAAAALLARGRRRAVSLTGLL